MHLDCHKILVLIVSKSAWKWLETTHIPNLLKIVIYVLHSFLICCWAGMLDYHDWICRYGLFVLYCLFGIYCIAQYLVLLLLLLLQKNFCWKEFGCCISYFNCWTWLSRWICSVFWLFVVNDQAMSYAKLAGLQPIYGLCKLSTILLLT